MMETKTLSRPPEKGMIELLRGRLFNTPVDAVVTVICGVLLVYLLINAIDWIFLSSIWSAEDEPLCREATGACWSVIDARHRIIFFGLFPYEEHWRSMLACAVMIATIVASCFPWFHNALKLSLLWIGGFGIFYMKNIQFPQ